MFKTIIVGVDAARAVATHWPSPPRSRASSPASSSPSTPPPRLLPRPRRRRRVTRRSSTACGGDRLETRSSAPACRRARSWSPMARPGRALHLPPTAQHADLIVVGSAHRGRVGRVLAGDVTAGTLHDARLPRPRRAARPRRARSASCAPSGSASTARPSRVPPSTSRARIAEAVGARLRVIDVVAAPEPGGPFPGDAPDWTERRARPPRAGRGRASRPRSPTLGEIATGELPIGDPAERARRRGRRPRPAGHRLARLRPDPPADAGQHLEQAGARGARARCSSLTRGVEDDADGGRARVGRHAGLVAAAP